MQREVHPFVRRDAGRIQHAAARDVDAHVARRLEATSRHSERAAHHVHDPRAGGLRRRERAARDAQTRAAQVELRRKDRARIHLDRSLVADRDVAGERALHRARRVEPERTVSDRQRRLCAVGAVAVRLAVDDGCGEGERAAARLRDGAVRRPVEPERAHDRNHVARCDLHRLARREHDIAVNAAAELGRKASGRHHPDGYGCNIFQVHGTVLS